MNTTLKQKAFTLIEILVVMLVVGIISITIMIFFAGSFRSNNRTVSVYNSVQQSQVAIKPIIEQIKYATSIIQPSTSTPTSSLTLTDVTGRKHAISIANNLLKDSINNAAAIPISRVPVGAIQFTLQNNGILITIWSMDLKYSYATEVHKLN